jgi:malate dehydrogenase (oxaloacetate-decarboxylating)(NADP+)
MMQIAKAQSHDILHGIALLNDPVLNKGTAFSLEERRQYGLEGFLSSSVENIDR